MQYAVGYLLITAVALVFLNIYAAATMRNLAFSAQQSSMHAKAQLLSTSLNGLDEMTLTAIRQTVNGLEDVRVTRIVVMDRQGYVLYDTARSDNQQGKLFSASEARQALENQDVLYSKYENGTLEGRAAMPVYTGQALSGAVYLMDLDEEQGALIDTLQINTLRISIVLAAMILLFSLIFSAAFSRRLRRILHSVRMMRDGDYSNQIEISGHDELKILASEFNDLTVRLRESEERRRQFVSDASHELKTPLASVKLLADSILQNQMDEATVREFVGDISDEADRLTRLSQKLLELNRIDSHVAEEIQCVEVGNVIGRVVRMLTPMASQRGITIEESVQPGCTVMIQGDDLYQIIFNLVENGIKYNVPNGWLGISLSRTSESIIFTVSDTGVGIPEDAIGHIFERFYRVDKARSRNAGGAGLGLSIVHDMVQRNAGTISVSRRETAGTCFTVTFPYVNAPATV